MISRVVNFREIQKLEEGVGMQKTNQEKFDEQYKNTQELISSLEAQKNDRSKLEQAKKLLSEFYADKEKEWTSYEKEEKDRDVKSILEQYNVAMVHALIPRGAPSENTLLRSDISWQEKLKIILAFEPTISTSTISPENQVTWRNMGVLLSGGRVEAASPHDAGTKARGLWEREVRTSSSVCDYATGQWKPIEKQLQEATAKHESYNEVVVGHPEVAGFFIKVNEDDSIGELGDMDTYVSPDEVFSTVRDMNLPLFVVKGGEVYHANPDTAERVLVDPNRRTYKIIIKLGEKIPPVELAKLPSVMDKKRQDELVTEIMDDSPFKFSMAEAHCTDAMNGGRETYVGTNFNKLNSIENIPTEIYQSIGKYENFPDFVGKEMKILGEIKSHESIYRPVSIDGELYTEKTNKRTGKRILQVGLYDLLCRGGFTGGVDIGLIYGPKKEGNKPIDSTGAYLERMQVEINEYRESLAKAEKEHWEHGVESCQHFLRQAAFHLYGYADEAEKYGDVESQEATNLLASEVLSRETYDEIVRRRIGPNGEFRITKKDLEPSS